MQNALWRVECCRSCWCLCCAVVSAYTNGNGSDRSMQRQRDGQMNERANGQLHFQLDSQANSPTRRREALFDNIHNCIYCVHFAEIAEAAVTTLMTATTVNATITTNARAYTHTYTRALAIAKCRLECCQRVGCYCYCCYCTHIPSLARLFAGTYDRAMVINHFNCHFRNTILSKQQRGCFLHFSHSILFYFTLLYFYFLSYVVCCFRKCPLVFYAPSLWPAKAICRSV